MTEQMITGIDEAEFHALIDAYIDRTAHDYSDMPAGIFFDLLLARAAAQVEDTRLILEMPEPSAPP
jgi:hypothetical protein